MEETRAHHYPRSSATQESVNWAQSPAGQVPPPWSPTDQPNSSQSSHQHLLPSSLSFNSNLQPHHWVASGNSPVSVSAQPIPQNSNVATLPQTPREPFDRLAVPSFGTGLSRSRSNSRSSRHSSRRNTPAPTPDQAAEQYQVTTRFWVFFFSFRRLIWAFF